MLQPGDLSAATVGPCVNTAVTYFILRGFLVLCEVLGPVVTVSPFCMVAKHHVLYCSCQALAASEGCCNTCNTVVKMLVRPKDGRACWQ